MPLNNNYIVVVDLETSGKNPHTCEPLSIGAVVINPKNLTILPDEFYSIMKPDDDVLEELKQTTEFNEALLITSLNLSDIEKAPHQKYVWEKFVKFLKRYTEGKGTFGAPILAGYNVINYDKVILNRMTKKFSKNHYNDEYENNELFNAVHIVDAMHIAFEWFENMDSSNGVGPANYQLSEVLKWLGVKVDGAHNALWDAQQTSELIRKFMRRCREGAKRTKWIPN